MNKKSFCIVTSHSGTNYGSKLQATALYKYIEGKGFDVSLLNQWRVYFQMFVHPTLLTNRLRVLLNRKNEKNFFGLTHYNISPERKQRLDYYTVSIAKLKTVSYISNKDWKKAIKDDTYFIAGSDIIWNPAKGYPSKYFLDFAYNSHLRMASYASSIGERFLPKKYYKGYRKYLSAFSYISTREKSAAQLIENIIHKHVEQVLDPTLLFDSSFWDEYANQAKISVNIDKNGFILCYFVMDDDRYWNYVIRVKEKTGLQVVVLPMRFSHENKPYSIIKDGTPCEFLWLIKNAKVICTDSFHACVFALNYKKEFYLLRRSRKSENDKYDDFLERYGLLDRSVTNEAVFEQNTYIDYDAAYEKLIQDREKSRRYLDRILESEG